MEMVSRDVAQEQPPDRPAPLAERLERGELVVFEACPFALPADDDQAFLFRQELGGSAHKNISFNPQRSRLGGCRFFSRRQVARLQRILADFSGEASRWLAQLLPRYGRGLLCDRASFRPEEEAIRKLRLTARNDLLHLDAFPSRPTAGSRILRLFVNVHPADARVWATSETFAPLLAKYGAAAGLPSQDRPNWSERIGHGLLRLFQPGTPVRTRYDSFMLRFHHFLKSHEEFQEKAPRKLWQFAPGSAWLLFSDGLSHAELRGRYALEHSFFVSLDTLALREESPAFLLERACGVPVLTRAA